MVSVLVIKPSSLGDIIHSAAAVEALSRSRIDCRVTWVVNEEHASFVSEFPGVHETLPFPRHAFRRARFPLRLSEGVRFVRRLRRGFDLAVDLQGLQRSALMARLSGAPERFGPADARELGWVHYNRRIRVPDELGHAVDRVNYLAARVIERSEVLGGSGGSAPIPDRDFRLPIPRQAVERLDGELPAGSMISLCPGARWESKLWPEERWAALLAKLHARHPDLEPVFLGSGTDAAAIDRIVEKAGVPARSFAGRTDLWETAAVLERSAAAITLDSAPLHLAASLGTPTVALFGPTSPERVAPRGERHTIVRRDLECLECYARRCPLERRVCLPDLDAESVLAALECVLER